MDEKDLHDRGLKLRIDMFGRDAVEKRIAENKLPLSGLEIFHGRLKRPHLGLGSFCTQTNRALGVSGGWGKAPNSW